MRIKELLIAAALLLPAAATANPEVYQMRIAEIPDDSGFKGEYDASTDTWTLTCGRTGTEAVPKFTMNAIDEAVPEQFVTLCFDYIAPADVHEVKLLMHKVFTGKKDAEVSFYDIMPASEGWTTLRIDLSRQRTAPNIRLLNKAGQYQDVAFPDLPAGTVLKVRNPRYETNEYIFSKVTLSPLNPTLIEAENFNAAVNGTGAYAFQNDLLPESKRHYVNPTGNYFPVYAWGSVDYPSGLPVAEAVPMINQQYRDLWDCGFTLTVGSAFSGVDKAFLFDGREINGVYCNTFEGTDLKMICKAGLNGWGEIEENVPENKTSDRLAGWFIRDEPFARDLDDMREKAEHIRSLDPDLNHILYGNLHPIESSSAELGFTSYDDMVRRFVKEVGTGFISFDIYVIRRNLNSNEIYVSPAFFRNLETVSKLARHFRIPFWAFTYSQGDDIAHADYIHPVPQENYMRIEVFGNLAYGAQGIQYYMYRGDFGVEHAPLGFDNKKTETWNMVRNINMDIKALTWVFLGDELVRVGHTNAVTPEGCVRLTPEMLPEGVKSVTSDGDGVCVSVLRNGRNLFLMVLNPDPNNAQKVTLNFSSDIKRVLMDGTTTAQSKGTVSETVESGRILLYQVSDSEPLPETPVDVWYDTADYRPDAPDALVGDNAAASGARMLQAMGNPLWDNYSAIRPDDGNRTITPGQAAENWGARARYTVTVPEEMTVDIAVGHAVPFTEYSQVARLGVKPGYEYEIEGNPSLNWPAHYAAAMTLQLDGETLTPSQASRPVMTEGMDGAGFEALLDDPSRWTPTTLADGTADHSLWFWPESSADDGKTPRFNDTPDYVSVKLTPGEHTFTVTSLSYPWNFDCLRITPVEEAGISGVSADKRPADGRIFNLMGTECHQPLAPGIYVQRGRKFIVR